MPCEKRRTRPLVHDVGDQEVCLRYLADLRRKNVLQKDLLNNQPRCSARKYCTLGSVQIHEMTRWRAFLIRCRYGNSWWWKKQLRVSHYAGSSEELNPWRRNRYLEVENNHLDPLVHRKLIHPLVQSRDFHLVWQLLGHWQKWNNKNL